jgi:glutamine synthetase
MCLGRKISNKHYQYCLEAGINICGTNSEVVQNQWEYQIGVVEGITIAD